MINIIYFILILIGLSKLTYLIVWSKIFGNIKGYFKIGMLDNESFIQQIVNCCQCLGIWIGFLSIPFLLYISIVPIYITIFSPLYISYISQLIEHYFI
jgi:hypothetical protein